MEMDKHVLKDLVLFSHGKAMMEFIELELFFIHGFCRCS
jgi:hypothetical protein